MKKQKLSLKIMVWCNTILKKDEVSMILNLIFSIIIFLIFSINLYASNIVFSPLQMDSPEKEFERWVPVVDVLKRNGIKNVVYYRCLEYPELLKKLQNHEIAISYLCPLTYVIAKSKNSTIEPLFTTNISDNNSMYKCVLFTNDDGKIDLKSLKGKKYALVSSYATCGYFSANYLYRKYTNTDLFNEKFNYLNTHNDVVNNVVSGEYDIGMTNSIIFSKYLNVFRLKKLAETPYLPGFVIVVDRKFFDDSEMVKIKSIIKKAFDDPNVKKYFPFGIKEISDRDYDIIRKMGISDIPQTGNMK